MSALALCMAIALQGTAPGRAQQAPAAPAAAPAPAPAPRAPAVERGPQVTVQLRQRAGAKSGRAAVEDADGITIEEAGSPPQRQFIRWDLVRAVDSAPGQPAPALRAERLAVGELVWRGRMRLERGDAAAAEPLLAQATAALVGQSGPLALEAWSLLLRARLALGGELADAAVLVPALRAGAQPVGDAPAPAALADPVDAQAGLVAAAPPAWATSAQAARASAAFRSVASAGGPAAPIAQLYAQIAAADAGSPEAPPARSRGAAPAPGAPAPRGALAQGMALLEAWAGAVSNDADARRRGRETLKRLSRELSSAMRGWCLYAVGRSLSMEADAKLRRTGATEMLKAAAEYGALSPILAQAAQSRAAAALDAAGDAESAASLRASAGLGVEAPAGSEILASPAPAVALSQSPRRDLARSEAEEARALSEFLERAGLDDIFALHLEEEVMRGTNPSLGGRLCEVLERLAAAAQGTDRVAALRIRIEFLLARDKLPCGPALRLALARAEYRLAAASVVAMRRGDAEPSEEARAAARDALERCSASLESLERTLSGDLTELRMKAGGSDEVARTEALSVSELVAAQLLEARYLRAWSRLGALWVVRAGRDGSSVASAADELVKAWAALLETGKPFPAPEDASVDLRGEEYYASSIMGMAMTKALATGFGAAEPWFDLLGEPGVWAGVAAEEPAMRLEAAIDSGAFADAARIVAEAMTPPSAEPQVPAPRVRRLPPDDVLSGCALRAVREARGEAAAPAAAFARAAFEALVARGSLGAAQQLAARIPALARGDGFAPRLAAALAVVVRARAVDDADRARPVWEEAARALAVALSAPDASGSRSAPAALALRGWALASAGEQCLAADVLAEASTQLDPVKGEEAAWLSARLSEDARCTIDGLPAARGRWVDYLSRYPDGPHANAAMVALARFDEILDPALADRLLAVPPTDAAAAEAGRAAARIYYRLARSAVGEARADPARRLFMITPSAASTWPADWIDPVTRQQLELALDAVTERRDLARSLIAEIASRYPAGQEPSAYRAELATRRLELALLDRRFGEAAKELERVRAAGDRAWLARADALFARDVEAMLGAPEGAQGTADESMRQDAARALIAARRGVLETARRDGNPGRADAAALGLARALLAADAKANAAEAESLARGVLARKPVDRTALEITADAVLASGNPRSSRDALVTLLSVLSPGSADRARRQCQLIELLAIHEPDEARKLLAQQQVFDPTWGPAPWGDRLKSLAVQLGVVQPEGRAP